MRLVPKVERGLFSIGLSFAMLAGYSRAQRNSVPFQAAVTDSAIAREDRNQAREALLPSVKYDNSGIYTQGNGPGSPIRFIANNAVREYISQGNVHESFALAALADARRAAALSAVARAKQEIALRGLVLTVVQGYYGVLAA